MKKVKIVFGVLWALFALLAIILLFPGLGSLSAAAARLPFMKINPNYTGGEIARRHITECCTLDIRQPVFDGLIGERKRGFVQVDWRGNLPEEISDSVDYDFDDSPDFSIQVNRTGSATVLNPISSKVIDINISTPTSYGWAARINILK